MASGVVTVGSRRYAVGLYWENSPGSGRVAQIAREAATQTGQQASFYAVRPGNKNGRIPQFGLSGGAAGQLPGMPVLAGCLAGQIPGSWAGAFRLNEGIVVIIVRDDLIVPDGDLFFADEAEARDRLIQEIGFGGLQNTYAPESWSITGSDTIPLTLLLDDRRDIKLQAVQISDKLKKTIAFSVLGFILVVGAVWYWQQKVAEDAAAQAAQEENLRRLRENASNVLPGVVPQAPPPAPKYQRVWEEKPPAMQVVHACNQGLAQIPASVSGWKMSELKCDGNTITFSWSRNGSMMTAPPPGTTVNDTGSSAGQSVSLPPLQNRGSEALIDPDVVTNRYLLQNWPGTIGRMADDPPPPPPPDYKGPWNPPPAPWVKRSFTLSVSELELSQMIGDLPGAIVTSMTLSPENLNGTWNIQGVIYENRK